MTRLTATQAKKIGYMKITDWFAIQPIEIKDGTFILPKEVLPYIEKFIEQDRVKEKQKITTISTSIKKYPIKKLDAKELKVSEELEITKDEKR